MSTTILACNNCNTTSEKGSISVLKGCIINNNEKKKEQSINSSDENNNSTNHLEIIDYPYSNSNEEETFKPNDIDSKTGQEIDFLDVKLNNNYIGRNFQVNALNNSSGIINNEDSITQNKNLLKNLYSNYNKENNDKENKDKENKNKNKENNDKENIDKEIKDKDNIDKENKDKEIKDKENNYKENNDKGNKDKKNNDKGNNDMEKNNKDNININNINNINNNIINNNINKDNSLGNDNKSPKNNSNNMELFNDEKNKNYRNIVLKVDIPFPNTDTFIIKSSNNKKELELMKTDESQERIINKRKIKNIKIKKLSSSKNKTNETCVYSKVKKKLNIKSDLIPYNKNKNLIINTNDIYNKKNNNGEKNDIVLFSQKIKSVNRNKIKKLNEKIVGERKTSLKNDSKTKPFKVYKSHNKKESIATPLVQNNLLNETQNYKQILFKICKINYICRNTISNYGDKTNKYTNFLNLKKYGNQCLNLTSKTYVNPFENIGKKKLMKNLKNLHPIQLKRKVKL